MIIVWVVPILLCWKRWLLNVLSFHDNIFNRAVLKDNSLYYHNAEKVTEMLNDIENICTQHKKNFTDGNVEETKDA